jgi:hypothetical protein
MVMAPRPVDSDSTAGAGKRVFVDFTIGGVTGRLVSGAAGCFVSRRVRAAWFCTAGAAGSSSTSARVKSAPGADSRDASNTAAVMTHIVAAAVPIAHGDPRMILERAAFFARAGFGVRFARVSLAEIRLREILRSLRSA